MGFRLGGLYLFFHISRDRPSSGDDCRTRTRRRYVGWRRRVKFSNDDRTTMADDDIIKWAGDLGISEAEVHRAVRSDSDEDEDSAINLSGYARF